jgi:transcriptional regulator ATRX
MLTQRQGKKQGTVLFSFALIASLKGLICSLQDDSCASNDQDNLDSNQGPRVKADWWKGRDLQGVEKGYKVVLLLHILAYAEKLDEKVLVFSQCMKTLNYLEEVFGLSRNDLKVEVPSLTEYFPDHKLGAWRKNKEYLRIDGDVNSSERGILVDHFNRAGSDTMRAFLISVKAGGIGINLVR